jgi:hypothetical protein
MKWNDFENHVRTVASYLWDVDAKPEVINGVRVDCVLKKSVDHWIIIEITQEESLEKFRTDLGKFAALRQFLFSQDIYSELFFISEQKPPPSVYETGRGNKITVFSLEEFDSTFFDYRRYHYARLQRRFGSAVDPVTGDKDTTKYIPVQYYDTRSGKPYSLKDIAWLLQQSRRVVLLGSYGTGKSRCIQELFSSFKEPQTEKPFFPLSIDLRDNWGTKRGHEIIRRHFDDLGLSSLADNVIKIYPKGSVAFLLDGLDEIGSQAWSDNPARLKDIRADSLLGVKDLVLNAKGGVLITGREHYFNTEKEMYSCLGLREESTMVLKCADEFTIGEMQSYLAQFYPDAKLPPWLPRRPLICQVISKLSPTTINAILSERTGEIDFWHALITSISERESRIHIALDAMTIRRVLRRLARVTRNKPQDIGPLSTGEINKAFEEVTGHMPVDESAVMLQRLPALGRLSSETTDRQFVDYYILDGLRAEDVIEEVLERQPAESVALHSVWANPLRTFGLSLLSKDMTTMGGFGGYMQYLKSSALHPNKIIAGDILAAFLISSDKPHDFQGFTLADSHISYLDLSNSPIKNLSIKNTVIDTIDISDCTVSDVLIESCLVDHIVGISAARGLPAWIVDTQIERFESVSTVSRIRQAELSPEQRIFVIIVKKLFFQPGAGRQEEALLRGLGEATDKKAAERIMKTLMHEEIICRFKGAEGWVYKPNRQNTRRMGAILTELTLSKDPLWINLARSSV